MTASADNVGYNTWLYASAGICVSLTSWPNWTFHAMVIGNRVGNCSSQIRPAKESSFDCKGGKSMKTY